MENSFRENENHSTLPLKRPITHAYLSFIQDSFCTHQSDILPRYQELQELFLNINTSPSKSNTREDFEDYSTESYFYEGFLKEVVKQITSADMTCSARDIINSCLKQIIRIYGDLLLNSNMASDPINMDPGINHKPILESLNDMIIYTLKKDILSVEDIQYNWTALGTKPMIQYAIHEGFTQSKNDNLKIAFLKEVILHLSEISSIEISDLDYLFISSLFDLCQPDQFLLQQYIEFSWKMLSDHAKNLDLSSSLFENTSLLITKGKLAQETKLQLFEKFIKTIASKDMTLFALQIIRKLLESYPKEPGNQNELTFSDCLSFLCKEKELLAQVISELKSLLKLSPQEYSEQEVSERVQFIDFLIDSSSGCSQIMNCKMLKELWDSAILCTDHHRLSIRIFSIIKGVIDTPDLVTCEELLRLLREKFNSYKDSEVLELLLDEFECLKDLFLIVNEYMNNISDIVLLKRSEKDFPSRFERLRIRDKSGLEENGDFQFQVDVMPTKLEGCTILWKLATRAENEEVSKRARRLLVSLYTSLNTELLSQIKEIREEYLKISFECLEKLRPKQSPKYQILRCFDLIHALIDMSYINDKENSSKRPILHYDLDKAKLFTIKVQYGSEYGKEATIKVYSNILACDLLSKCMKQFRLDNDAEFYLEEPTLGLVINTLHKTRTISSLGIKDHTNLELRTRLPPEAYLVQHDNTVNPKAREIFIEWFENYSDNGKMNAEQFVAFDHFCTKFKRKPDDRGVREVFDAYDDDKDCYLTLDNFLTLYFRSCKQRQGVVWKTLSAHQINRRLKKPKQSKGQNESISTFNVISLINSNNNLIELLFYFVELEEEIASKAFELLNRLPIHPRIFSDIVLLNGVKNINSSQKPDWSHILDRKHKYKLFYCLSIVDYLASKKGGHANDDIGLWSLHPELLKHKKSWLSNFGAYGGFNYLDSITNKLW